MQFLHTLLKILTLHTFFISLLTAMGMILSAPGKAKNQILFGIFMASGMIIFYFFLYESGLLNKHHALSAFCFSGGYLIGPMLYFLVLYALNNNFKLRKIDLLHFIPAALLMLITPILSNKFGHEDISIYMFFFENRITLGIAFISDLSFSVYLFLSGSLLIKKYLWNKHSLLTHSQ